MKRVEAIWEKDNIGSNVLEITVERNDLLNENDFCGFSQDYDYVVVKVPSNKTDYNWFLGKSGYTMIETQLKLSKDIKNLDLKDRYLKRLLPDVSYEIIHSEEEIENILQRITPDMFITDRITLDPLYGPEVGCARYKKYIKNSFLRNSLEIIAIYFKHSLIGFEMHHIEGKTCYGKLGGLFSDVKIPGLGFLTCCAPLLFSNEKYGVTKFIPDISANNIPVLKLYDYFQFHIEDVTYVFVKHNIL